MTKEIEKYNVKPAYGVEDWKIRLRNEQCESSIYTMLSIVLIMTLTFDLETWMQYVKLCILKTG